MVKGHRRYVNGSIVIASAAALAGAAPACAAQSQLDALVACGDVSEAAARLTCFDDRLKAYKAARSASPSLEQDSDRKRARPTLPPFSNVMSTVANVVELDQGKWLIVLADRSVWQSYEGTWAQPARGDTARIRKGPIGGFLADIGQIKGARVKRLR